MSRTIDVICIDALVASRFLEALKVSGHTVSLKDISKISESAMFTSAARSYGRTQYKKDVVSILGSVCAQTFASLRVGHTPLILGGDHSIAIGSVGAALAPDISQGKHLGLVWIDAHDNAHTTATTFFGHAKRMPLAILLGRGAHALRRPIGNRRITDAHVLWVGACEEDCDMKELNLFKEPTLSFFDQERLRNRGWMPLYQELCSFARSVDAIWVSIDLGVLKGIDQRTMLLFAEELAMTRKIVGADIIDHTAAREESDVQGFANIAAFAAKFAVRVLQ